MVPISRVYTSPPPKPENTLENAFWPEMGGGPCNLCNMHGGNQLQVLRV